jgi:hypothetical protein
LLEKEPEGLGRALFGGNVVLYCRGMALILLTLLLHVQACAPLLRE